MASTPVSFQAQTGHTTPKAKLFASTAPDTVAGTYTATERTSAKGEYAISVTDSLTGLHVLKLFDSAGTSFLGVTWYVNLADTTTLHKAGELVLLAE